MRVLIISAFLACAAAAPSGWTFAVEDGSKVNPAVLKGGSIDTLIINEIEKRNKLAAEAQAILNKSSENIAKQATENLSAKAISDEDLIKENNAEAVWSLEEKKWQALDAIKTAEAQIDGHLASISPILAKNAIASIHTPYLAAITPAIASLPLVYTTGFVTPDIKGIPTQSLVQSLDDSVQVEAAKSEATVKTAEPEAEKPAERSETIEAGKSEAAGAEKSEVPEAEKRVKSEITEKVESAPEIKSAAVQAPLVGVVDARFPLLSLVPYSALALQPAVAYSSAVQHGPILAPSVVQHTW